ncbi:hypothetical protein FHX36_001125 [Modestobacter versicolor]|uniref:Uncharacterized protein n=2 Tax=Modestobacter versicolor TaxID=429133 RepID=A0A839XUS8_9ACTN|nr:hypothetical protein [Modestobacter versicolor]MBB3675390.1 hypothetical protein [Modestobacter versicolor]
MSRDDEPGPDPAVDAVTGLLPRLGPLAVLLTDDRADAVRLLSAALATPSALDDAATARRALTAPRDRPRWAAEQVVGTLAPVVPADEDPVLAAALRSLPAGVRAAAVLRLVDGPPAGDDDAVAALAAAVARGDDEQRRERDRATAAFRAPGAAAGPAAPAVPLADRLARLAAGRPLPPTAAAEVAAAVAAARRGRRRRRYRLVGAAALVAVLLALVPLLPQPGPPAPVTDVYAGSPRGSLAGDEEFLREMRAQSWSGTDLATTSPPATRRVVFAGDVPGGRWALVVTGEGANRAAAWFSGPEGAQAGRLRLRSVALDPDPALPVSLADPSTGALVVVGAPGDTVAVSERPEVTADGSLARETTDVPAPDGVAVAALTPLPGAPQSAVRVEVERDGRRVDVAPPVLLTPDGADRAVLPEGTRLRPAPRPAVGDSAVAVRLATVLGQLGQSPATAQVTTLWAGDLPGPNDQPTRLTVVALPQPSGAVVVTAPYGYAADLSGRSGSSWCGTGVLPAGEPLDQRVVAVQCDLSDGRVTREISRFLVVLAPPTATSVQLLDAGGVLLSAHPMADGVAVVRSPGEVAMVTVTGADGGTAMAAPLVDTPLDG